MSRDDFDLEALFSDARHEWDDEMRDIARLLHSSTLQGPPLDPAFRSSLRRQLLKEGWSISERRPSLLRRLFTAPNFAWAAATVGALMIAFVVVSNLVQPPAQPGSASIHAEPVANRIEIHFNQSMDHSSVESQLHIVPATRVSYHWQGNTLVVQGHFSPNTQYQVVVPKTVQKADHSALNQPIDTTFETQPPPSPSPTPTVAPITAGLRLGGARKLADAATGSFIAWRDSTVFYRGAGGELRAVGVDGQNDRSLHVQGVKLAYLLQPTGQTPVIAFVNASGIGVVPLTGAQPTPVDGGDAIALGIGPALAATTPSPSPSAAATPASPSPANQLEYVQADKVFEVGPDGARSQVASLSAPPAAAWFVAPSTLLYREAGGTMHEVTLGGTPSDTAWTTKVAAGPVAAGGPGVVFAGADGLYASDVAGHGARRIVAYSALNVHGGDGLALAVRNAPGATNLLLVSTPAALYALNTDGSSFQLLAAGEFSNPAWAADGASIGYQRQGHLSSATVESPDSAPTLQEGDTVVKSFMDARVGGDSTGAMQYLDPSGQAAFQAGGAKLVYPASQNAAAFLHRYFFVLSQQVPTKAGERPSLRYVVRLVLADGTSGTPLDQKQFDETLILQPDTQHHLLIHTVSVSGQFPVDSGPRVIGVDVAANGLRIWFDSDLNATTVPGSFTITDAAGNQVQAQASYDESNRVVNVTYVGATSGAIYSLAVGTSLKDIAGNTVGTGYSLQYIAV